MEGRNFVIQPKSTGAQIYASYLSSLELRRLAVEDIARLYTLGEHPYGPIEHALDVGRNLENTKVSINMLCMQKKLLIGFRATTASDFATPNHSRKLNIDPSTFCAYLASLVGEHLRLSFASRPNRDLRRAQIQS